MQVRHVKKQCGRKESVAKNRTLGSRIRQNIVIWILSNGGQEQLGEGEGEMSEGEEEERE